MALRWLPLAAALLVCDTNAQQSAPETVVAKPCDRAEHRQFDFWLGEWEVHDPTGKRVGENRITRIHGGCALLEEWRGNGGVTGSSLNAYDRDRKLWQQAWVDSTGGVLKLDGGFAEGAMTLRGESTTDRTRTVQRIRWQPHPDGRVRQHWETSADDGKTWSTAFDGWYTRRR